uniref:C2H2-type domain-containing protein n=1 Tax=Echeneis naucrates TaxID=173247 RepID=A0A665WG48_ECHNA
MPPGLINAFANFSRIAVKTLNATTNRTEDTSCEMLYFFFLHLPLFCFFSVQLVEQYASRRQVPLPQLRILEIALCYFARASSSFTLNCDHVLHTLSRLALSVFELLLFFDQDDFHQELLENFVVTFQECHLALARYQNVHLLQVERLVQAGGPWASSVLQAILSESNLLQNEVDGFISSELPVFFELRVRYLLSCKQVSEAMALAKCCARHPTAGQHLFFLQVYLTWLCKTSQHDRLCKEVDVFSGKDAVHIICSLEYEEKDDLLLALSRAFLLQQLQRGDMHYLCDLVFIWSKLHSRLNTSKDTLLEESHQLMLSATNVNSIFPFIRAILFAGLVLFLSSSSNALLRPIRWCTFFICILIRSTMWKTSSSTINNEFWNLIALRTNCLKLMSEKVVSAALEEIMEDNWINSYFTKELGFRSSTSVCKKGESAKKRHHKDDNDTASKRLKVEESKLEYCCTFCNKVFKGSRVVAHAMFHYRKDECMFCGTMFKDDLLAMMHLSDHIEKLKKIKESETKDVSTPKTSAKGKTTNMSSGRRTRGGSKKSAVCFKSESTPASRKLRSNDKPVDDQFLQEKEQNASKRLIRKTHVHKINGHIGRKKELYTDKKDLKSQEKVCCPVDGCAWFTDLSKNRVALLYHALEDHSGEVKPLELAFRVGNSKCAVCMRVLWSFEHFQHHVERHRITPRHPCLHQGCTARFKTGMEMRRHTRRHSPLQAMCCLPGCPKLFICLWALNLHEREHYGSKSTKPDKIAKIRAGDKHGTAVGKKQQDHKPKDMDGLNQSGTSTAVETSQEVHQAKKCSSPQEHGSKTDSDVSKSKKHKVENSKVSTKIVRKKQPIMDPESDSKQSAEAGSVVPQVEAKAAAIVFESSPVAETSQSTVSSSANSVMTNGQASKEDVKSTVCKEALASYSKKPYMRLPPTAYLDEKYITMPKRRKEISLFQLYQRSPPAGQASATATLQRQRCANCFATFHSAEDLQSHIQLQKCSNLFGFDSDDEGDANDLC